MKAWHMDRRIRKLPKELKNGTILELEGWTPEKKITGLGYRTMNDNYAICKREGNWGNPHINFTEIHGQPQAANQKSIQSGS